MKIEIRIKKMLRPDYQITFNHSDIYIQDNVIWQYISNKLLWSTPFKFDGNYKRLRQYNRHISEIVTIFEKMKTI